MNVRAHPFHAHRANPPQYVFYSSDFSLRFNAVAICIPTNELNVVKSIYPYKIRDTPALRLCQHASTHA